MLEVDIPNTEFFDEATSSFVVLKGSKLLLEHSLISVSKWEAKWHQPFLHGSEKTPEQMLDYVRCMSIGRPPEYDVLNRLPPDVVQRISDYIEDPMTATTFSDSNRGGSREIITSELVYSWMVAMAVPFECEKWHLNRLLTLIRIISIKNAPEKKMSRAEIAARNRELNAQRLSQYNTAG